MTPFLILESPVKILIVLISVLCLTACEKPPSEWQHNTISLKDIKELSDCTRTEINTGERREYVYRCPNSETTTGDNCGIGCETSTIVIDRTSEPTTKVGE